MEFFEEMLRDMDFRKPRIIITDDMAVLENVSGIIMLSEAAVTVSHGLLKTRKTGSGRSGLPGYTTITVQDLIKKEICEGRVLIGGKIQRAEFLQSQGSDSD